MTDISKCDNKDCPIRDKCYRFTAKSGEWQTYADFQYDKKLNKCVYFWEEYKLKTK